MKYAKNTEEKGWEIAEVYEGPEEAVAAQVAILESRGFKRVVESARPRDTPYVAWSAEYTDDGDAVQESWWSSPFIIPLDRSRLLAAVQQAGMLEQAIALFSQNEAAQKWWAESMTYVEGSPMAEAFREAFGLSLDQIHAMVEASRA